MPGRPGESRQNHRDFLLESKPLPGNQLFFMVKHVHSWILFNIVQHSHKKAEANLNSSLDIASQYPLVNCHITMENHYFFMGKSTINGHFQ